MGWTSSAEGHNDSQSRLSSRKAPMTTRQSRAPPAQRPRPRRDEACMKGEATSTEPKRSPTPPSKPTPTTRLRQLLSPAASSSSRAIPTAAVTHLNKTLTLTKDPRTLAWTHIYLHGRSLRHRPRPRPPRYRPPRAPQSPRRMAKAVPRAVRDAQPDTKAAAEKGLKEPGGCLNASHSRGRRAPRPERQSRKRRLSSATHPDSSLATCQIAALRSSAAPLIPVPPKKCR